MTSPIAVDLDNTNTKKIQRIRLAGTTVPSSLVIRAQWGGGYPDTVIVKTTIYDIWLEIELAETGSAAAAGVFGAMDDAALVRRLDRLPVARRRAGPEHRKAQRGGGDFQMNWTEQRLKKDGRDCRRAWRKANGRR
jgi:hypothetical protein